MKRVRVFNMLTVMFCLLVAGAVALAAQGQKPDPKAGSTAQPPKGGGGNPQVVETKSEVARGAADPNVKSDKRVNDPKAAGLPAPAQKGGEKQRGGQATCDVRFDNRTKWYIHVFVDGEYDGLMRPWGDIYTYAIAGPTVLYGRADFTDGSRKTWGPVTVRCPAGGMYTWRLFP